MLQCFKAHEFDNILLEMLQVPNSLFKFHMPDEQAEKQEGTQESNRSL